MSPRKLIEVMDTSYRDGLQSVFGARCLFEDFQPSIQAALDAGIKHFEAGGGARFQSLFFYLNENAFDMMDAFRKTVGPDVVLQTLARGVNYVGLDTGSRDILKLHARLFKKHGITTIRNFDALNHVANLDFSGRCIEEAGLNHEVVVTLMDLPPGCSGAHDVEFYEEVLRRILDSGVPYSSICFKDASGTSSPRKIHNTILMARKLVGEKVKIRLHTHETAGVSVACYLAALEAGVDGIDLAREPLSGGTSQPDFLIMMHALKGTRFVLGNHHGEVFDGEKILESEHVLQKALEDYEIPPEARSVSALIPFSPMPGGALTANSQMMRDNNILEKLPSVILAMREVVEKGGFGTSVTPVSQFYFQQAFNNVIFGPWERIADGYGKMVLGYFGKTPVEPDAVVKALCEQKLGLEPTTEDPLDIADRDEAKSLIHARKQLALHSLPATEENLFIVADCQDKGIKFLKGEATVQVRKRSLKADTVSQGATSGTGDQAQSEAYTIIVNGARYDVQVMDGEADLQIEKGSPAPHTPSQAGQEIRAGMSGTVLKIPMKAGDPVQEGNVVLVLESMKMEIEVRSPFSGTLLEFKVRDGQKVNEGDLLLTVG